jgi:hypothetical protein
MTDDKNPRDPGDDDLDPSDWLASQFGDDSKPPTAPVPPVPPVVPPAPVPPAPAPTAVPPAVPPVPPVVVPPLSAPPVVPPAAAPPVAPPAGGAPFQWGLTPGAEVPVVPAAPPPAAPEPPSAAPAQEPPAAPEPPVAPQPPIVPGPPAPAPAAPPILPDPPVIPQPTLPPYEPPAPTPSADAPTRAFSLDDATQVFPAPSAVGAPVGEPQGQELEQRPWDPWQAQPVDASLDGVTEVIEAEIVGLESPEGESNPTPAPSSIDDLFGDSQFRDYEGEPLLSGPPGGPPGGPPAGPPPPTEQGPKPPRAPIPRVQKILMWIAGGLVAVLALIALFLLGSRLASTTGPAPALSPSPSATPTAMPTALPAGPLPPGEYQWDELLGGECLDPFESAWQDRYTVVDCAVPHPAQMVFRGQFPDAPDAAYPGVDELNKRIDLLCTAPTVINYQVAGTAQDIQVAASFAATAEQWDAGDRTFFCFANRASGESLTASIAVPQQPAP